MADYVLVIGGGGREHALAWKLSQSSSIKHIYVAPGNAGTQMDSTGKISNCDLNVKNYGDIVEFCKEKDIKLVVIGPEDPLANGISDYLTKNGINCFGPCQKAAQIEASKEFAKSFMDRHGIPTARWKSFTNINDAKEHILSAPYNALVVKASGLAAGKGVIVGTNKDDAIKAIDILKEDKGLSTASETIVIEELLIGEEVSVLCFSDGTNISVMPPAQDHKRLLDNDEGPNTGGMGAYCRCPQVSESTLKYIEENIMKKAIEGMKIDGSPYVGVLYAGLMMTKDGPKVLEFNCRFGDPETQVILPLLQTDLYNVMTACVKETLSSVDVQWASEKYAVGVVVVSGGYPGSYPKGKVITGLDNLQYPDYIIFHAGTSTRAGKVVTSGGRVLVVVAIENNLQKAAAKALKGAEVVQFDGAFFRKDIAQKALRRSGGGMTYKSAGVDIESADDLVNKIKSLTKETLRSEVHGGIGGFGGIFNLKDAGYVDPYLVSRGRGIGEKLKVAQKCGKFELLGNDLVANSVNEILCHGAEPLFFLDTYTCGKLDINVASQVITGIAKACKQANCVLIGGETAEMPGMYIDGDFDLTAFARGAVEKSAFLPKITEIHNGDIIVGLTSSSINNKGFGILRKLIEKQGLSYSSNAPFSGNSTIEDILMSNRKIYVKSLLPLMKKGCIKAAAYINDEGLTDSILRVLPFAHEVVLDASMWSIPPVFNWIATNANFSEKEMFQVFNCGIDMVLVLDKDLKDEILETLVSTEQAAVIIGSVKSCEEGVKNVEVINSSFDPKGVVKKTKVAVLTSGNGLNLQTLLNYTQNSHNISVAEISKVISNETSARGLELARKANISIQILNSTNYKTTDDLESALHEILKFSDIDIVCLDEFSHKLSSKFLKSWQGKLLDIHPSILPAFNCDNVYQEILSFGARITGCTVFFPEPEGMGDIIEQAAINVATDDTEETLKEKIQHLQYSIYPKALELVARKRIFYSPDLKLIRLEDDTSESNYVTFDLCNYPELNQKITSIMDSTSRPGFKKNTVSLCGIFDLKESGYQYPYLVSGTDGVGTKLKIAQACNKHDTIGIDLVAMCVNDILTHGAEPLFFLECFDCGKLNPDTAADVISGIADGCKQANCALIGAEISQIPDIYLSNKQCVLDYKNYDVVGYAEGALLKENLLPKVEEIREGDILIGLASSGIHSNGYSLVRKVVENQNLRYNDISPFDKTKTLGEILLTPTKIYVRSVLPLMKKGLIKGAAHVTGGGLTENIPRILPKTCRVVLDSATWDMPAVLKWVANEGQLSKNEMLKTFNCGLGMILITSKENKDEILEFLKHSGETAACIGSVKYNKEGEERVEVQNFMLQSESSRPSKRKVGVLISGSGTNLQALIDYTQNPNTQSKAEIVLVLSNVPGVEGLKRAEKANIPTKVLSHKAFKSRVEFDMAVHSILQESGVEFVCLAGFMRIVSKEFVQLWQGRLLNVHPALLPAFKGMNAHKQVLKTGARITGCTVHFVEPEVDAGAVIMQAAERVDPNDTEKSLQEKVKVLEHKIFPAALELLASGRISRGSDGKLIWHF